MTRLLNPDEVAELLSKKPVESKYPPAIQIGPLRWYDVADRCASRGCTTSTFVKVQGIPYCMTHALYALNYLVLQTHSDYESESFSWDQCTCNAGRHSMGNRHTEDCPIYVQVKGSQ